LNATVPTIFPNIFGATDEDKYRYRQKNCLKY
jgi:hypothetical protein